MAARFPVIARLALVLAGLLHGAGAAADPLADAWPLLLGDNPGSATGMAVAVGDLDGDQIDDLAVGAPGCDLGAPDAGCVAVFYGGGWPWPSERGFTDADVLILGTEAGEGLGAAVGLDGDLDGDQIAELVVTAPGFDGNGWDRGRVGIFFGGPPPLPAMVTLDEADVIVEGAGEGTALGDCVDHHRDLDGDGQPDLALGARGAADGDGDVVGAVFVLPGQASWPLWLQVEIGVTAGVYGETPDGGFGASCASVGDQDGDGVGELLIGAPAAMNDDAQPALPGAGEVFLVRGGGSGAVEHGGGDVLASWRGAEPFGYLGGAVADAGDVDGSGAGDLAFSAVGAGALGPATGAVYVFLHDGVAAWASGGDPYSTASVVIEGEAAGGWAGAAIAGVGDVDLDGVDDLLVAAPLYAGAGLDAGRLYLISGDAGLAGPPISLSAAAEVWDGVAGERVADALAAGDLAGHGWGTMVVGVARSGGSTPPLGSARLLSLPDLDGDGFCPDIQCQAGLQALDCDPLDPGAYPGAAEIPYDGIDQDCDGADVIDLDGDGAAAVEAGGSDCDDLDATIHLGANEVLCDGIDQDCDGTDETDGDGDGYDAPECGGDDCDDATPTIYPGAPEVANGADDDCDGVADEGTALYDDDGDGYCEAPAACTDGSLPGDCDDEDPALHPGASEVLNGVDDDCDELVDEGTPAYDDDGDGFTEFGGDCDDANEAIHPGAEELYDGIDNDCDGLVDEAPPEPSLDVDGDGYCPSLVVCDDLSEPGDCDDTDPNAFPGAAEVPYDGVDQDCDGADLTDVDGDGYDGENAGGLDCDDADADIHPGRVDLDDDIDNDCDGDIDEDAGDYASELGGGCRCASAASPTVSPAGVVPAALLCIALVASRRLPRRRRLR